MQIQWQTSTAQFIIQLCKIFYNIARSRRMDSITKYALSSPDILPLDILLFLATVHASKMLILMSRLTYTVESLHVGGVQRYWVHIWYKNMNNLTTYKYVNVKITCFICVTNLLPVLRAVVFCSLELRLWEYSASIALLMQANEFWWMFVLFQKGTWN